ncbi:hypothetical protein OAE63_00245 [bacterium]|nr:hypothetical protein [bacterium]
MMKVFRLVGITMILVVGLCVVSQAADEPNFRAMGVPAEISIFESRGVKKVERPLWPINSEVASSAESKFWVEIEANLIGGGEETSQKRSGRAAVTQPVSRKSLW